MDFTSLIVMIILFCGNLMYSIQRNYQINEGNWLQNNLNSFSAGCCFMVVLKLLHDALC